MPVRPLPLPLRMSDKEALVLPNDYAVEVFGLRAPSEKLVRAPGMETFGTGTIAGIPRAFAQVYQGSSSTTERLLLFTSTRLYLFSGGSWTAVNGNVGEADAGSPVVLTTGGLARPSVAHTLGAVYFVDETDELYVYNGVGVSRFSTLSQTPSG